MIKDWYKEYCKLSEDDLFILWLYFEEELKLNINVELMRTQWDIYNTMSFHMYKINYHCKELWKVIKREFLNLFTDTKK